MIRGLFDEGDNLKFVRLVEVDDRPNVKDQSSQFIGLPWITTSWFDFPNSSHVDPALMSINMGKFYEVAFHRYILLKRELNPERMRKITRLIICFLLHSKGKTERSPKQNRIPHEPEWRPPDEVRVYHDVSPRVDKRGLFSPLFDRTKINVLSWYGQEDQI